MMWEVMVIMTDGQNTTTHALLSNILAHYMVSQELVHIASGGGIPTTAKQTEIPMTDDDLHHQGDLITLVASGGRNSTQTII
jgi:hypothetical protein